MPIPRPSVHLPDSEPWLGVNFWSRLGGPLMWRTYDDDLVRSELSLMADHGVRLTRSFMYWPDFHPAPYTIADEYVERYRQFLRAHVDLGMKTIPTFIVGHMSGQNWDVSWRDGRNLYSDGFVLGQQSFFIREMTRRLGGSPAIAGWLISNEVPIFGGPTTREYGRAWGEICVSAVRAGGSDLPVSLGDGAWTREIVGRDNGFRLRDQLDLVDFVGPHSYPEDDDQFRQLTAAALICELTHFGKPVILEEFGVTSSFASEANTAHYYRQALHHSLLSGATGWIGWNNTDFDLMGQEPYSHHGFELSFGVSTVDGQPKAALRELAAFRRVLDAVQVEQCSRPDTETAIVVPSFLDVDVPMNNEEYRASIQSITHQTWLAARRADLAPALVRESVDIPQADLLILPSAKALMATTFSLIAERAHAGATVYLSFFAGPGPSQRGAWWPRLEPLFGVRHELRPGLIDISPDLVELTVATSFGGLEIGTVLISHAAGPIDSRAYLPLEVLDDDVEVLLVDAGGHPALVRKPVGAGSMLLGAYPLEWFAAARRDGSIDDPTPTLYGALAAEAGITPAITVGDSRIIVDGLVRDDGVRFSWMINLTGDEITAPLMTSGEWTSGEWIDISHGAGGDERAERSPASPLPSTITMAPFAVRILRLAS